jgi:hypothetical protein
MGRAQFKFVVGYPVHGRNQSSPPASAASTLSDGVKRIAARSSHKIMKLLVNFLPDFRSGNSGRERLPCIKFFPWLKKHGTLLLKT